MEVKNEKALDAADSVTRVDADVKRKQACRYAAYLTAFASSAKRAVHKYGRSNKRYKAETLKCCGDDLRCCSGKAVLDNYANFGDSGEPARVMYFQMGEWVDFPAKASVLLKEGFRVGKSAVEVAINSSSYLVDFLRMVEIDLKTGFQRSIAWIDENDKCFFPKFFFDGNETKGCLPRKRARDIEVKVEIGISKSHNAKSENCNKASVTHLEARNVKGRLLADDSGELEQESSDSWRPPRIIPSYQFEETCLQHKAGMEEEASSRVSQSAICTSSSGTPAFGMPADKLIKLEESDDGYVSVKNRFFAGLKTLVAFTSIVGIYRSSPTSSLGRARKQSFEKYVEITRKFRGNANVRYAWHSTRVKDIAGIMSHGFGQSIVTENGADYGTGVYFAPEDCSNISAAYSDIDENGEQHLVLCQVILGNMEQVQPGSQQFYPSSEYFDSGTDDLKNPKRYIIWSANMNTHIYPEYVVSFKVPPQMYEYWAGLKANQSMHDALGPINCCAMECNLQPQGSTCEMMRARQSYPVMTKEAQQNIQGPVEQPVKMPTSAWMPFPMLFSVIGNHLSLSSIDLLERYYGDFKKRKITREDFIKRVRMIAGDKLLIAAIKSIKSQKTGMQEINKVVHSPDSLHGSSEKAHLRYDFSSLSNQTSIIEGPTGLQGQSPHKPKTIIDAQLSCKNEFTSLNGQVCCRYEVHIGCSNSF